MKEPTTRFAAQFIAVAIAAALLSGAAAFGGASPDQPNASSADASTPLPLADKGKDKDDGKDGDKKGDGKQKDKKKSKKNKKNWKPLFDGEKLGRWQVTQFGGQGDVRVDDGRILLPLGANLTGITWKGEPPRRMNYELSLEAMRVEGTDFFCGLTFPVGEDPCSLIIGGWGGGVVGLSNINGYDASQNNTSQWINFDNERWYKIRLRVTERKIEAWIDDKKVVNVDTKGKEISIRPEVELSKPLGIASWQTTAALRNIKIRRVKKPDEPA